MAAEEKQIIIEAWDKHIEGTIRQQRLMRFSSVADAEFCETFRNGIMANKNLTKKEKLDIYVYTNLSSEKDVENKTDAKARLAGVSILKK